MSREEVDALLQGNLVPLGVDAFTFYVRDPCWTGHLLQVSTPGVTIPEAVYGLRLEPEKYRHKIGKDFKDDPTIGEDFFENAQDDYLRRDITPEVQELLRNDLERNRLFGDFIYRENIASRAWFLSWNGKKIVAALSVNYRTPKAWNEADKSVLRALFANKLLPLLDRIESDLRDDLGRSAPHFTSILEHTWRLTTSASRARDPDSGFRVILEAACAAFDIKDCDGGGTIHLYHLNERALEEKSHYGCINSPQTKLSIEGGAGLIAWVALRQQTLLINDLPSSKLKGIYVESVPDCHSALAVPMLRGEELLGVLILESTKPGVFSSWASVGFLAHAASQAAIVYRLAEQDHENRQLVQVTKQQLEEAKQQQIIYESLVESLPQHIFRKDKDGRFQFVNQRFCKWMGKTKEELLEKTDLELQVPLAETYRSDDRNVMETGESLSRVEEHLTAAKEMLYVEIVKTPLYDAHRELIGTQGIFWDVTEQKRAERRMALENAVGSALAESKNRRDAISRSLEVICTSLGCELGTWWRVDRHAGVLCCEKVWARSAANFAALVAWNDNHQFRRGVGLPGRVWERGGPQWATSENHDTEPARGKLRAQAGLRGTFGVPIRDGSEVLGVMEFFSSDVQQPDQGQVEMWAALGSHIGQYITRKQAEDERDQLFQLSLDLFCVAGFDGYFKDLNPAWEKALGFSEQELLAKPYLDFIHPEDREVTRDAVNGMKETGTNVVAFENRYLCKDGSYKWLSWNAVPVTDDEMIYAVARATTEQVPEHDRLSLHDQAHLMDLVEPLLDKIVGLSQITPEAAATLSAPVRKARTVVRHARAVARTMLNFLRAPSKEIPPLEELTECGQAVHDWFTYIRFLVSDRVVKLHTADIQLGDTPFLANRDGVLYSLYNLVNNANKAIVRKAWNDAPTDGTSIGYWIIISAATRVLKQPAGNEEHAEYIVLSVADNGAGMPPTMADRIFKSRITPSPGGQGLGSQIVRRVMDYHQGLIRFTTRENVGTLVELWFPRFVNGEEKPLANQWKKYEAIRQSDDPVRIIEEIALRTTLSKIQGAENLFQKGASGTGSKI